MRATKWPQLHSVNCACVQRTAHCAHITLLNDGPAGGDLLAIIHNALPTRLHCSWLIPSRVWARLSPTICNLPAGKYFVLESPVTHTQLWLRLVISLDFLYFESDSENLNNLNAFGTYKLMLGKNEKIMQLFHKLRTPVYFNQF